MRAGFLKNILCYGQWADLLMKFFHLRLVIDMAVCLFVRRTMPKQGWGRVLEQAQGLNMVGNGKGLLSRARLRDDAP